MSVTEQVIKGIRGENLASPFVNEPLNCGSEKLHLDLRLFQTNSINHLKRLLLLLVSCQCHKEIMMSL